MEKEYQELQDMYRVLKDNAGIMQNLNDESQKIIDELEHDLALCKHEKETLQKANLKNCAERDEAN